MLLLMAGAVMAEDACMQVIQQQLDMDNYLHQEFTRTHNEIGVLQTQGVNVSEIQLLVVQEGARNKEEIMATVYATNNPSKYLPAMFLAVLAAFASGVALTKWM
jgi:hypothetical protein